MGQKRQASPTPYFFKWLQVPYLYAQGRPFEIITDIGSGIDYRKKGLQDLIRKIESNQVEKVVILYKDRLLRFGFDLIETIATIHNCKIEIVDTTQKAKKMFQFAGASRFAYNWALDRQMANYYAGRKLQSDCELRREFTEFRNSGEASWLLEVSNNVTKQAIKDLCIAYRMFTI